MYLKFNVVINLYSLKKYLDIICLRARAANDTTRGQINNIPSKSPFIPLLVALNKLSGLLKLTFTQISLTDQVATLKPSFSNKLFMILTMI